MNPKEISPGRWVCDYNGLRYGVQVQGNLALAYTCDDPTDSPTRGTVTGYRFKTGTVYFFGITAKGDTEVYLKELILQAFSTSNYYLGRTS